MYTNSSNNNNDNENDSNTLDPKEWLPLPSLLVETGSESESKGQFVIGQYPLHRITVTFSKSPPNDQNVDIDIHSTGNANGKFNSSPVLAPITVSSSAVPIPISEALPEIDTGTDAPSQSVSVSQLEEETQVDVDTSIRSSGDRDCDKDYDIDDEGSVKGGMLLKDQAGLDAVEECEALDITFELEMLESGRTANDHSEFSSSSGSDLIPPPI